MLDLPSLHRNGGLPYVLLSVLLVRYKIDYSIHGSMSKGLTPVKRSPAFEDSSSASTQDPSSRPSNSL